MGEDKNLKVPYINNNRNVSSTRRKKNKQIRQTVVTAVDWSYCLCKPNYCCSEESHLWSCQSVLQSAQVAEPCTSSPRFWRCPTHTYEHVFIRHHFWKEREFLFISGYVERKKKKANKLFFVLLNPKDSCSRYQK